MTAAPAILKRIRGCPFARGGRVLVRFRANGYSLFACRSGEPLARVGLTRHGDEAVLPLPPLCGGGFECEPLIDDLHGFGKCGSTKTEGALDKARLSLNVVGNIEERRLVL